MTALLLIHGLLVLFAVKRGWRVAPFLLLALPRLVAEFGPRLPDLAVGGWALPLTNLLFAVGALSTISLLYTAVADPEPA